MVEGRTGNKLDSSSKLFKTRLETLVKADMTREMAFKFSQLGIEKVPRELSGVDI